MVCREKATGPAVPDLKVPGGFLWGASWSAYEVEGNCQNTDLWAEEHAPGSPYRVRSGDAVDHYHRWREDLQLLARLRLNAVRLSIEWSRIEPEPGCYSTAAIAHYRAVLERCLALGLSPIVTLHHTASPRWLIREGGWRKVAVVEHFRRYCATTVQALGDWIPMLVPLYAENGSQRWRSGSDALGIVAPYVSEGRWREHPARVCGTSVDDYAPYWSLQDYKHIDMAYSEAREVVRWLKPMIKVGRSIVVESPADIESCLSQSPVDFMCIEYHGATLEYAAGNVADVMLKVAGKLGPDVRWLWVDHLSARAGAATRPEVVDQSMFALQAALDAKCSVIGWLHGQALDGWRGPRGFTRGTGLVSVDPVTLARSFESGGRRLKQRILAVGYAP